tara:strand:+ start:193 stop:777 length:585 start_codon:yes stop_codon:yes gene_type:complete
MHISKCKLCTDIHTHLNILKQKYPEYYCRPVSGSGSLFSKICLIGLAPGLHGANKTGIPFTSDFSGDVIRSLLKELAIEDIFITNAVRCYPEKNKPNTTVINNCQRHNYSEIKKLTNVKVIISLGSVAYYQVLKLYNICGISNKFIHGNIIKLNKKISLISSYHCSKLNFNTKRIDKDMLKEIFIKAKKAIGNE